MSPKRESIETKASNPVWLAVFGAAVARTHFDAEGFSGRENANIYITAHIKAAEDLADLVIQKLEEG